LLVVDTGDEYMIQQLVWVPTLSEMVWGGFGMVFVWGIMFVINQMYAYSSEDYHWWDWIIFIFGWLYTAGYLTVVVYCGIVTVAGGL
jgi:hypothetical protein